VLTVVAGGLGVGTDTIAGAAPKQFAVPPRAVLHSGVTSALVLTEEQAVKPEAYSPVMPQI